ncbi:MAG: acetyl-CoA C-acetyltransferase, partial [Gammaproteobacteria bacterium]|nr:acetyl-CoA C-acetyltransferase [Gammaproteobacteria bacterium]
WGGRPVYVVDGSRTPYIKARGKPGPFSASELAIAAGQPLLARQPFAAAELDEVILGCMMPSPDEANIARVVALRLGCGERVPAWTVQRNCASGMQSIDSAAQNIASGRSSLVLAGGVESMSRAPILYNDAMVNWLAALARARTPGAKLKVIGRLRPGYFKPVIALLRGLTDPVVGLSMGQTAEILAHRFDISREMMDSFAMRSHQRLDSGQKNGHLDEIEVIYDRHGNFYDHDDGVRADSTMENLAKLRPVFDRPVGKVTAGNSAQITDGAAWVVLASEDMVSHHNLPVLGQLVDSQWAGLDPAQMGLGPCYAMGPVMRRRGYDTPDIDYFEINEAFAAQVLACLAAWKDPDFCRDELGRDTPFTPIDEDRLNIDGGAVAVGHPVGSSGARIVLHMLKLLERNNARRGMTGICIGGGQGGAMLIERTTG